MAGFEDINDSLAPARPVLTRSPLTSVIAGRQLFSPGMTEFRGRGEGSKLSVTSTV
jgi:hypothetical protein